MSDSLQDAMEKNTHASRTWLLGALTIFFVLLAAWPALSIRESLWVDELHSVWAISGDWNEVAGRAAMGNQSPLYFYGLKVWADTAGMVFDGLLSSETILRASSLLGWWILCVRVFESIYRTVPMPVVMETMIVIAIWLSIDRIGAFYAMELRPYIWVAVVSLVVMRSGASIASRPTRFGFSWLLSCAILFYLHYTTIFVVALSWCALVASIMQQWNGLDVLERRKIICLRTIELFVIAAIWIPGLLHLRQMLGKSKQWANFANDLSVSTAVDLLPWLFWVFVPMFAFKVHRAYRKEHRPLKPFETPLVTAWLYQLLAIGIVSLLLVGLLTYAEIAPLWHRRYVMGAYPAIVLLGACWLGKIRSPRVLLLTGLLSALLLVCWQGTLGEWKAGRIIAWQRQEDWRGAVAFLREQRRPGEPIFIVPMLIETAGSELPLAISYSYLRFPLSSIYRVEELDAIEILPNYQSSWAAKIANSNRNEDSSTLWIIARVDDDSIRNAVIALKGSNIVPEGYSSIERVFDGGRVQVVKLEKR